MDRLVKTIKWEWISKIPIGKRWKARKYAIWLCGALWIWLFMTPVLGTWTHWWSFTPNFAYIFALSFLLWILTMLALPYGVKRLDSGLKNMDSFFRAQAIAFTAV